MHKYLHICKSAQAFDLHLGRIGVQFRPPLITPQLFIIKTNLVTQSGSLLDTGGGSKFDADSKS